MINRQYADSESVFKAILDARLDCVVFPGFAVPPVKHGHSRSLLMSVMYTFLHNVLDMPSAAVPVTLVLPGEDRFEDPRGEKDLFVHYAKLTSADSVGLPVGIQVACLPYQDEQLAGVTRQFEALLPFSHIPLTKVNRAQS